MNNVGRNGSSGPAGANVGRNSSAGPTGANVGRNSTTGPAAPSQRVNTTESASFKATQDQIAAKLANPEARAQRVNQMYDNQFKGHGNSRHGAGTTLEQHKKRVETGARPEGGKDRRPPPASSRWESQQAQLAARHQAQSDYRNNEISGTPQPGQPNRNMAFKPDLGGGVTGTKVKKGDQDPTEARGAKVILKPGGGYLTDYPE